MQQVYKERRACYSFDKLISVGVCSCRPVDRVIVND
jgi:hypothetical protein